MNQIEGGSSGAITIALGILLNERDRIDTCIATLQGDGTASAPEPIVLLPALETLPVTIVEPAAEPAPKGKRGMSPEARKKIAMAQKKRWAAARKEAATPKAKKRKVTARKKKPAIEEPEKVMGAGG